jgi:eukaryotic-like serine/threonine-protein kinase
MTDIPARLTSALADRYALERTLGEGGMATVYLADDLKHNRKVAIKVLKPELAAVLGGERFLAEIQTTANLQHPHILPLFDSGEADHFLYYVMPFVEGESLRDRLDRDRQLPVDEALRIAKAVASALDYAHRRDIIHRDIKPANILLHDGQPVIADFGIALAVSAAGGGRMTETGLSLGTPHYMSPEQASADRELTGKSDIYALGCATYEMLAGTPPFSGHNAQSILMQILTEDPKPVTDFRKTVPPHVAGVIARSLEKLPADRFDTADAFAKALDDPTFTHATISASTGTARASTWSKDPRTLALGVAVLATLAFGWMDRATPSPPQPPVQFTETVPENIGASGGSFMKSVAVDPKGENIYLVGIETDRPLWRRNLASGRYTKVPGLEGVRGVDVSPDGSSLLLFVGSDEEVMTAPVEGGAMTPLGVGGTSGLGFWGSDEWIYYRDNDGAVKRTHASGGDLEVVLAAPGTVSSNETTADGGRVLNIPRASIAGTNAVLFSVRYLPDLDRSYLGMIPAPGDTIQTLMPNIDPIGLFDGTHILGRADDGSVVAIPFDPGQLRVTGPPVALPLRISGVPSSAGTERLFVFRKGGAYLENRLVMVTREGVETPLDVPVGEYLFPRFSPDGKRLAMEIHDALGGQIWMLERGSGALNVLTSEEHNTRPLWFPDGSRVLFSRRNGFYSVRADGGGDEQLVWAGDAGFTDSAWLPDGRLLFGMTVVDPSGASHTDLVTIRPGEGVDPEPFIATPANEGIPSISPDGKWVAYSSDVSGESRLYVTPSSGVGGRFAVSTAQATNTSWGSTGHELLYVSSDGFYSARLSFDPDFSVTRTRLFDSDRFFQFSASAAFAVDPNGDDILFVQSPEGSRQELNIIVNFAEQIRRWLGGEDG